jgi:hypothetical protein
MAFLEEAYEHRRRIRVENLGHGSAPAGSVTGEGELSDRAEKSGHIEYSYMDEKGQEYKFLIDKRTNRLVGVKDKYPAIRIFYD